MARTLNVYPKAYLEGSNWRYVLGVGDKNTGASTEFVHVVASSEASTDPVLLLKLCFDLVVGDTDTFQDVDDAMFVDDIKPGGGVETVWGNWQNTAEGIISGLTPGFTQDQFWAEWSKVQTTKVRNDARRALITQRGWTVPVGSIHQHEGDGTVTEE